jgi:hypothetical protein
MVESSVEAESELVEVRMKMLGADAVMNGGQPGLEVGKDAVDDRQILFRYLPIAPLGDSEMLVAALAMTDEPDQSSVVTGVPAATTLSTKPQSASALRSGTIASRTRLRNDRACAYRAWCRICAGDLDGAGNQRLLSNAAAVSSRPTTDIAFIDFDVLTRPAANPILIWSNHTGTELMCRIWKAVS